METIDQTKEDIVKTEKIERKRIIEKRDSVQFNCQDLDQEQNVDLNPKQFNTQNIHIHIGNENYSGKLSGTVYLEKNKCIVPDVKICLFLGRDTQYPVHETYTDHSGRFIIEDIPPGYYTLLAKLGDLEYRSHYIKILSCQSLHESIMLRSVLFN